MPRAYSFDLRQRVVAAALEAGQSRDEIVRRFAVGCSSVDRWIETAQAEGRLEAKPMRDGSGPVIRDEAETARKDLIKADNHLTLAERRTGWRRRLGCGCIHGPRADHAAPSSDPEKDPARGRAG